MLQTPALLSEVSLPQQREEHGVQVHAHQVGVVPAVLSAERVDGGVRGGEGVHECGQGAVQHLEEGVPTGVPLGPTQGRVLQDVGRPRAVHRRGAEGYCECIVAVRSANV